MTKDPYRYFRIEVQELIAGLGRGLLELDQAARAGRGLGDREGGRELLRLAHTLKGGARVVKLTHLGELAHGLEDLLLPLREGQAPDLALVDLALGKLDEIRAAAALIAKPAEAPAALLTPGDDPLSSVRVEIAALDELVDGLTESYAACAALSREVRALGGAAPGLGEKCETLAVTLAESRHLASALRLVPASALTGELERAARDAARVLEKQVEVRVVGHDIKLDAALLASLRGALRHVVSNAVAHGIEDAATRRRAGKPAAGTIEIHLARDGERVLVTCRDDGRGLDYPGLRRAAVARGLLAESAAADEPALIDLLLRGGLSTATRVDQVAGRGVGLDVVRETLRALKGDLEISSSAGRGTLVILRLPFSLAAVAALAVESDGQRVYFPLDSVRKTQRLDPHELARTDAGERLLVDEVAVPFVALHTLLTGRETGGRAPARAAVVVEAGGRLAAIGVERLGAIETIVVKRLPRELPADTIVAAASLDGDGRARLVLAPGALVAKAHGARGRPQPASEPLPPVLVVDDSLTTRMLEQSILESAGYVVELAVSAEEALTKMRTRRFGVMVVDVEMPGMSGFELLERLQRDPAAGAPPAILVTSRDDPADIRRGMDAGARAYIVKSNFDQRKLLEAVKGLIA